VENPWTTQERVYADTLAQAEYAEALGFDAVWLAEHHFSEYGAAIGLLYRALP
jgi:alkanesulfonate monooxygenase SsuD/methylene tetrahydromethanopterin reductase-like flavin-dependent oxidoreductase (luciferase family)